MKIESSPRPIEPEVEARYELMKVALNHCTQIALQAFSQRSPVLVEFKPDNSKVTDYDEALNSQFIAIIKEHFPKDTIIGEEEQYIPDNPNGYVWTHDPIDGTSGFIRNADAGTPRACTSAGMATLFRPGAQIPCMAGVDRISTNPEFYYQHDGMVIPEFMSGRHVPAVRGLVGADHFANVRRYDFNSWSGCNFDFSKVTDFVPEGAVWDKVSSIGLTAGRIAVGRNDFHLFPGPATSPHDYAPAMYLVGRARGAVASNLDGQPWSDINMHLTTNGVVLARTKKISEMLFRLMPKIAAQTN